MVTISSGLDLLVELHVKVDNMQIQTLTCVSYVITLVILALVEEDLKNVHHAQVVI